MGTGIGILFTKIRKWYRKSVSRILFNISSSRKANLQRVQYLSNIHKGKRAFIICNGPSLLPEDLEVIVKNDDISFACNKIDKIFSRTNWRPTYYAVLDETFQYSLIDTMNNIPASIKFFSKNSYIKTRKVSGNAIFLDTKGGTELLENPRFSEYLPSGIYTIGTTTYSLIQIAVGMGIKEIYIIGCDNHYAREIKRDGIIVNNGGNSYFKGASQKEQATAAATWQMNVAYEFARKYADTHGIKIYNATRGGYLEAFERVDFDTLF